MSLETWTLIISAMIAFLFNTVEGLVGFVRRGTKGGSK